MTGESSSISLSLDMHITSLVATLQLCGFFSISRRCTVVKEEKGEGWSWLVAVVVVVVVLL